MSPAHLTDEALDAFVGGDATLESALEAHLAECAACADRLARHAQADVLLRAARAPAPVVARLHAVRPWRRFALAAALTALVAGTGLLRLGSIPPPATVTFDLGEVICPDGDDQDSCIHEAHAHGLVVTYPSNASGPDFASITFPSPENP